MKPTQKMDREGFIQFFCSTEYNGQKRTRQDAELMWDHLPTTCHFCNELLVEESYFGIFMTKDPRFGTPPGKQRMMFYKLCKKDFHNHGDEMRAFKAEKIFLQQLASVGAI